MLERGAFQWLRAYIDRLIYLIPNLDPDSLLTHCLLILEKVFSEVGNAPMLISRALSLHHAIPLVDIIVVSPSFVAEFQPVLTLHVQQHILLAFWHDIQGAHSTPSSAGDNALYCLPSIVRLRRVSLGFFLTQNSCFKIQ